MNSLFVPGRICLFGEHSDWAGGYRRTHPTHSPGRALIACTNQGVYAHVRPHPNQLIVHSTLNNGQRVERCVLPMEQGVLEHAAQSGDFYSYAAGVAAEVLTRYAVKGLEIDNYRTDLPVKKGLSSSAAICVLVARAFSQVYSLNLNTEDEADLAYHGERQTGSECGRMDQGCAYGQPIVMDFDGDSVHVERFTVGQPLHLLLVDLHASKDTRVILRALNECYPTAQTDAHERVQHTLGPVNLDLCSRALSALKRGDAREVGALMTEAQRQFDTHLGPICPEELTAPVLHQTLQSPALQPFVWGGKGVGAQGDGSAQFIARDATALEAAKDVIENQLGLSCVSVVL